MRACSLYGFPMDHVPYSYKAGHLLTPPRLGGILVTQAAEPAAAGFSGRGAAPAQDLLRWGAPSRGMQRGVLQGEVPTGGCCTKPGISTVPQELRHAALLGLCDGCWLLNLTLSILVMYAGKLGGSSSKAGRATARHVHSDAADAQPDLPHVHAGAASGWR